MSYGNYPSDYWSPNYGPQTGPGQTTRSAPPQEWDEYTAEFVFTHYSPPYIEAGSTARHLCFFKHVVDGPITFTVAPNTTLPTVVVKDANNATVAGGSTGVTINTVQADPSFLGRFLVQIEYGSSMPPGNYEILWSDTYQPNALNGVVQATLNIATRRRITVKQTLAPSTKFLFDTRRFGSR